MKSHIKKGLPYKHPGLHPENYGNSINNVIFILQDPPH